MQQVKEGKTYRMNTDESLDDFLNRVEKCIDRYFPKQATKDALKLRNPEQNAYTKLEKLL